MAWSWKNLFGFGGDESKAKKENQGPSIDTMDTRNPDQRAVQGALSSWISQYLPNFKPGEAYTGKLNAPMTGYENQGMGFLQQYLDQPAATPLLGQAGEEISKTLNGEYDPYTSPFYKSLRTGAMQEQQDAQNRMNAQLGARKKYFSSEALNENQQLQTRTSNFLDQTLAGLSSQERQNRLNIIPQALEVNKAVTNAPLSKVAAATSYGAIPRQLDQAGLEREYQAWLNQRSEAALPVTAATGFRSPELKTIGNNPAPGFDWGSFLGDASAMALQVALMAA